METEKIKLKPIYRDGKLVGYRTYKSGKGIFKSDIFEGYEWI